MTSPSPRTSEDVLHPVQENLRTAELGYRLLMTRYPPNRLPGLRNIIVFGRTVTWVLQNLRTTEKEFDNWYARYQKEMSEDPLMLYFKDLRNNIEKEGVLKTPTHVYISHLKFPDDLAQVGPPPPGATSFFIGDQLGGSGWEVRLPDGSVEKYYVELSAELAAVSVHFPDPPQTHLGKNIPDTSVEHLCRLYLEYLGGLVVSAKTKFLETVEKTK